MANTKHQMSETHLFPCSYMDSVLSLKQKFHITVQTAKEKTYGKHETSNV